LLNIVIFVFIAYIIFIAYYLCFALLDIIFRV
jgi:hypothetical protein